MYMAAALVGISAQTFRAKFWLCAHFCPCNDFCCMFLLRYESSGASDALAHLFMEGWNMLLCAGVVPHSHACFFWDRSTTFFHLDSFQKKSDIVLKVELTRGLTDFSFFRMWSPIDAAGGGGQQDAANTAVANERYEAHSPGRKG